MAVAPAIVNSMPCADHEHDSLIRATQIFESRCTRLPEFFVANVQSEQNPGKVPCRWTVSYKFRDANRQYKGGQYAKQLLKRFDAAKPDGTNIMKPAIRLQMTINDGLSYVVEYGVICACDEDPYFGETDDNTIFHISEIFPH